MKDLTEKKKKKKNFNLVSLQEGIQRSVNKIYYADTKIKETLKKFIKNVILTSCPHHIDCTLIAKIII